MLTPEQLRHFRERLEAERDPIVARMAGRRQDLETTVREVDGVGDRGDEAQRTFDRDEDILQDQIDRDILDRIEKALARIEDGTYGISEVSGKPIPIERLEAVPWATTLVDEPDPELE
jgi:RNA polymerase-binding protein DksA